MHINPLELQAFVENNHKYVSRKASERWPGLYVLKYKNNVFYDNMWHVDDFLLYARGLVVDQHYNIVVKPFTKVFNHGESGAPKIAPASLCTVTRKINGFMGVATYRPHISDRIIYSTTGSLDSDFVDLIEKHVKPYEERFKYIRHRINCMDGFSLIFEICDESDPHIVPENAGPWLIGGTMYDSGGFQHFDEDDCDWMSKECGFVRSMSFRATFAEVQRLAKECKHEGYMVHSPFGSLKIKSPYYLTTKLFARGSEKKLLAVFSGNKERVDEEYYPLVDYIAEHKAKFFSLGEQDRISVIREFLGRTC